MYTNIGGKIKGLACVSGWIFLIGGVIAWLAFIFSDYEFVGWICLPAGVLNFIGSWALYGFGQLIEDVSVLRARTSAQELPKAVESDELPNL